MDLTGIGRTELIAALEEAVSQAQPYDYPVLLGELERIRVRLWTNMMQAHCRTSPIAETAQDRLLTIDQASKKLGLSKDYLYRHADQLPFTVRPGLRQLRFSLLGIERYIEHKRGHRT